MTKIYIYIKDERIVSDAPVLISKECDRIVELDVDTSQPFTYRMVDGEPQVFYEQSAELTEP
tara:strand:+ start:1467 stop:1652 length:186 start_codon:yes stop_codon:yes gene_type:complete